MSTARSDEEKAFDKRVRRAGLAIALPALLVFSVLDLSTWHAKYQPLLIIPFAICVFGRSIAQWLLRKGNERFIYGELNKDLTARVAEFSLKVGVPARPVYVLGRLDGAMRVQRLGSPDRISVSRSALDGFPPGELDFLLVRSLVATGTTGSMMYFLPLSALGILVLPLLYLTHPPYPYWLASALLVGFFAAGVATLGFADYFRRRDTFATDRKAVAATGDLESAVAYLEREKAGKLGPRQTIIFGDATPDERIERLRRIGA